MRGKRVSATGVEEALNTFLAQAQADEPRFVLGFQKGPEGVGHRVFKDRVEDLSLFNPVFSANGALYLRRLFSKGTRMVLLMRPCEIRASVELQKLAQIEREAIIAVSVDCLGAVSAKGETSGVPVEPGELKGFFEGRNDGRPACSACKEKRGVVGDAGVRIDREGGLWVVPHTDKGEEFLGLFGGEAEEAQEGQFVDDTAPVPSGQAEPFSTDMDEFARDFAKCVLCRNCKAMCPVCYCVDCVFNGDDYLPKGDALFNKVFRAGSTGLPQGKELFHLIRMFHVSQSCVGCGACEEACPQGIPLTRYFKGISERLQTMFSYSSGRSMDETMPYVTFLEDELEDADD